MERDEFRADAKKLLAEAERIPGKKRVNNKTAIVTLFTTAESQKLARVGR